LVDDKKHDPEVSSLMNKQDKLNGMKVAILVENGFEEVEMTEPRKALELAGADSPGVA
jgi:protease I